jgi:ERF superfamily protein
MKPTGTKEVTLLDVDEQTPPHVPADLVFKPNDNGMLPMIERLAAMKDFDVAKLEKLIDMQERILEREAKAAFEAAFAIMQPDIPQIDEKGRIIVKGQLRSTYAKLEDIHEVVKPIIARHGFSIRHKTEWPADKPGIIRIVGILGHKQGHRETTEFEAPSDKSDYRSDIQSQGSTVSYGRRYTTLDLLNISTRGQDKDGQHQQEKPDPPEGLNKYWKQLTTAAEKGTTALEAVWACSQDEPYLSYRKYIVQYGSSEIAALRVKAKQVTR